MDEYIERERARNEFALYFQDSKKLVDECDSLICMLPAADVVEVRHGEWVEGAEHFTNGFYEAECSECGNYIRWNEGNSGEWNFCPNCGCKMD